MTRPGTQQRLDQALTRLLAGQPAVTNGELTVTNLCKEACVGRDSYYRSPEAVVRFTAARDSATTPGTELGRLRDQVTALKRETTDLKRNHSAQISELDDQLKTYAGQIQVLALASQQLQQDNQRLLGQLERASTGVSRLHQHSRAAGE